MEGWLAGKWVELLKEIAPRVNRVAFLFNPAVAPYAEYYLNPFRAAAAPVAERLEWNPVSLAILTLIELTLNPNLMVRPPKSLAVTLAN